MHVITCIHVYVPVCKCLSLFFCMCEGIYLILLESKIWLQFVFNVISAHSCIMGVLITCPVPSAFTTGHVPCLFSGMGKYCSLDSTPTPQDLGSDTYCYQFPDTDGQKNHKSFISLILSAASKSFLSLHLYQSVNPFLLISISISISLPICINHCLLILFLH